MRRSLYHTLAAVLAAVATLAFAASPAFASTQAAPRASHTETSPRAVNFVGTYEFHLTVGSRTATCKVSLKANGRAVALCSGNVAHWTAVGASITITYKASGEVFKGTKSSTGINTKAHPGSYTSGAIHGTWYAVTV